MKLAQKRNKDMAKLRETILLLIEGTRCRRATRTIRLAGDWKHFRECHIEPDWLLIYKIDGEDLAPRPHRNALGSVLKGA